MMPGRLQARARRAGRKFAAALLPRLFGENPGQTTRAPPGGFVLEINGI